MGGKGAKHTPSAAPSRPAVKGSKWNRTRKSKGSNKTSDLHFLTPDKKRVCYAYRRRATAVTSAPSRTSARRASGATPEDECPQA